MPSLRDYKREDFAELFASKLMDATVSAANASGLDADPQLRTIIIGLGGTGVRTANHIKSEIYKRFKPGWEKSVAFLAIDASYSELDAAQSLNMSEKLCINLTGINERVSSTKKYPDAIKRFMQDGDSPYSAPKLGTNIDSDGCGQMRLVGKIKMHDKLDSKGVDEVIVEKISSVVSSLTIPAGGSGFYDVYIICSGSGGTGSGGFLEMPPLVRKAMAGTPVHVHGIFYMPDAVIGKDPQSAHRLKANGYATLKELNYYQGMEMRGGYEEIWTYGNQAEPELRETKCYDIPYLVGCPGIASADALEIATETISEFIISMIVKAGNNGGTIAQFLSSAFISNANAPANKNTRNTSTLMIDGKMVPVERSGSTHEFPKCFAAIGFASAAVPKKIVRAYVVKKICEQAGIKPVSPADYAAMAAKADGTMLLPFRGMDDMPNGETGSAEAKAIIKPIANIHKIVHTSLFDYIRDLKLDPEEVTWKAIHDGKYSYTANTALIENMVANYTSTNEMNKLNAMIRSAFSDYRKNVCDYVKNEGPYAFANIYYGNFKGAEGGARYKGIRELLQDLVAADGVTPMAYPSSNAAACLERLQNIENTIRGGNKLSIDLKGKKSEQLSAWLRAYNMWVNARINEKRAKAVYKSAGELKRSFLDPANILAEQVMTFGDVLSTMADIYEASGDKMEGFQAFSNATDSVTEVNIAAVDISAYNWLKQQADDDVARLKAKNFRDSLVDNFFADPGKWLDVPENSATKDNGANKARLINPDKPVPAREVFDTFATEYIQLSVNTSIEQLFENQQEIGNSYAATAERIMQELYSKSKPRFDGQIPQSNTVFKYIKYPVALDNNAGNIPQIKTALVAAAQSVAGIQAGNIYPSYDSDAIMLYQQATTMEIYLLNNLANWEKEYELSCKNQAERLTLHGKSPDVERVALEDGTIYYKEYTPWIDYPSIVQRDDPEKRDANGELCHDGAVRLKEKELIEKAKEYGVLYSSVDSQGEWVIKRVYCDKTREWNFKITGMMPDPNTGLLPQGKAFADSVAVQNGVTLDSISKNVSLDFAGVLSESAPIEDVAWERAAKVLHAHHPMFCEIRRTCELFEPWFKTVMQKNTELLGSQRPGMFVHLLRGLVVSKTPDGAWVWNKADGAQFMVANYTPVMLDFIDPREKYQVENGLVAYNIFAQIDRLMPGDVLVDEYKRAKAQTKAWIAQGDMIKLQEGKALADIVDAERLALLGKGANNGNDALLTKFVMAMDDFNFSEDQLKDVEKFYDRVSRWNKL